MKKRLPAVAVATAMWSGLSLASGYSDIYVFGDSLFDTGNLGGRATNRVGPDYDNSPFGPVSPDLIAAGLGLERATPSAEGGTNYAVGAHRSLQTLESITAEATYAAPAGPNFNSLFYDLERTGRDLDRRALYLLDGGGNDIGGGLVFNEETAGVVATNLVQAATALKDRGANYVVLTNVPAFGNAPAGILFQNFANTQATSINDQIRQQIGDADILIFDAYRLLEEVAADPLAYGTGVTAENFSFSCFGSSGPSCTQGIQEAKIGGVAPDPDQFFFNDELHPTTIGQQVTADYLLSVLRGASEIAFLPEMGLDDMQAHWRGARPIMRANRWDQGTPDGAYTVWGGASGHENERDSAYGDSGENETLQYNMGLNYRFSESWYLGAMLSRSENELEFDRSDSSYEMESLDFSLLSGFSGERWFLEGVLSYSDLDYDSLERSFTLGPVLERTEKSDTSGDTIGALVNVGYNVFGPESAYRLGPLVGYEYIRVEVDNYTEKSGLVTALNVDDQEVSTGIWNLGVFGEISLGFCACELYSEAVYQDYGRDGSNNPRIGLVSQPGNMAVVPGYERDDDGWRWDAGLAVQLSDALAFDLGAGFTDTDNNDGVWVGGEVRYSF